MSTASDSFMTMFFGDFNQERVVEIPDASPDGCRAMLRGLNDDNFQSLIQLADKYLLPGLFAECVQWLKKNVTSANVCHFLPLGELYSETGEVCFKLLLSHGNDMLKTESFLRLPRDLLVKMFACDQLAADEVVIYGRAIDWAQRQLEASGQQDDPAAMRATLGDVLYLIRCPLFDAEEFANGPAESGIHTDAECVSVFSRFTAKKKPALFSIDVRRLSRVGVQEFIKQFGPTQQ